MTSPHADHAEPLPPEAVAAAIEHMNADHAADSLIIVRAFAEPSATSARMIDIDREAGTWLAIVDGAERAVRIPWPERVADRAGIRAAVVGLFRRARPDAP